MIQREDINAVSSEVKFLLSGHSYLSNNSEFAVAEGYAKGNQNIYNPREWYHII